MANTKTLRVVSKRQAAFFQRVLVDLEQAGLYEDRTTGYNVEQLRAALVSVDIDTLPGASTRRPCQCGKCGIIVDGNRSRKYAIDCPNRKKKPSRKRFWMPEIPMWIVVSQAVDHYETRQLSA